VVAKPTKRPTKRKLEPTTDKVMREGAPREAVKRINRADKDGAPTSGSASASADGEEVEAASGTRARRAAQAEKADTGRVSRRRSRRVTEKGTTTAAASTRYTPPSPNYSEMPSPLWVPVLMFTMFALGMLTIFLNYVQIVPGGETSNWYLLLGLGFILAGIITATQYR
jgi:hypothetical protein